MSHRYGVFKHVKRSGLRWAFGYTDMGQVHITGKAKTSREAHAAAKIAAAAYVSKLDAAAKP